MRRRFPALVVGTAIGGGFACTTFGGEPLPSADAGTSEAAGGSDGAPAAAGCGTEHDYLFCNTFEGPFPFTSGDKQDGTLDIASSPGRATKSLRAALPPEKGTTARYATLDRKVDDGAPAVILEADVYLTKAPSESEGEMGILAVYAGTGGSPWTAIVFAKSEGDVGLATQTPGFESANIVRALPIATWKTVRLEVDFATPRFRVLVGDPGSSPKAIIEKGGSKGGTIPAPLRMIVGLLRFNEPTPPLEIFLDRVALWRQ